MSKYARRKDANHNEVTAALEAAGVAVLDLSRFAGCLDCLCCYGGRLFLLEIKDGGKPPSARRLTKAEQRLLDRLTAQAAPVFVVTSAADALRALAAYEPPSITPDQLDRLYVAASRYEVTEPKERLCRNVSQTRSGAGP